MKKILIALLAGGLIGAFTAQAKLPPAPPKSDTEKKAEADKAAASKAKDAADLTKAQDKAVANWKKNHSSMGKK
jgi:gas vesicle protein